MFNLIVKTSLRFRGLVIALSCLFFVYGIFRLAGAKYDVFPEFAPPQVSVQTEAPGLAPEQVEILVTQPVENAINGVMGVETIRSNSIQGLSVISIIFKADTDIYLARQVLAERLATVATQLPQGVAAPTMAALVSSTGDLLAIGLTPAQAKNGNKPISLMELRSVVDWMIKPRLKAVPGVAQVSAFGGDVRQLQIQIEPEKLVQYGLSFEEVLNVARLATGIRGAGYIDTPNQRIVLQTEAQSLTPDDLAKTVLVQGSGENINVSVTLGDVARVVEAPAPPISAGSVMGVPGIVLNVWGQYGANTLETTQEVEKVLEDLTPSLNALGIDVNPRLFRAANFIEVATHNVKSSLFIGIVLVVIILFFFLFNLRTAAISCTAIPLSLLAGVVILDSLGLTLNTMTLGGLAIAIGEVVDDAVIDVENILRRLRENSVLPNPRSAIRVIYEASLEVRSAVVYATFAVILVFVPVLTLPGLSGRLFQPLGIAYVLAVLASLGVALTLTPALCLMLIRPQDLKEHEPALVQALKNFYRKSLVQVERFPRAVLIGLLSFTILGAGLLPFLSSSFLPDFREGHYLVHMNMVPGTSIQESLRMGEKLSQKLLKTNFVKTVAQRVGRAESDDTFGPHSSEFEIDLKHLTAKESAEAEETLREILNEFPGVTFEVNTFLTERIEETIGGYTSAVVVNIFGSDLDELDKKAHEVAKALSKLSNAVDVQVQSPPGAPQIEVKLRKKDLLRWGLDAVEVLDTVATAYEGNIVGQIYDQNRIFDVNVLLSQDSRNDVTRLKNLIFKAPDGTYVPLNQIADIKQGSGRYVILHEGTRRVQTVTCNVKGQDLENFVKALKQSVNQNVSFAAGTYFEVSGEAEAQAHARRDLLLHSLIAGIGIVVLLWLVMHHPRNLFLILTNLPFALVGGVLTAFLTSGELSIGSMVGFVTLFGITLRNSIMMISHFEHLVVTEGKVWGFETAVQGACERLVPVLMTALITAFGLLPLALTSGKPGVEIEGPMALVILGGLFTSTLLNLFVLPTLALKYGRFERHAEAENLLA